MSEKQEEKLVIGERVAGRVITVSVNGAVIQTLNTEFAVTGDYLYFISAVVEMLTKDRTALEKNAQKNGRTLASGFLGIGSVPLD